MSPARTKRIFLDVNQLLSNYAVQSYFEYRGLQIDSELNRYYLHGFLLPRTAPYNSGSYEIRICFPEQYPWDCPSIELLTYLWHPLFHPSVAYIPFLSFVWSPSYPIHILIECAVDMIDRGTSWDVACMYNYELKELFFKDKIQCEKKICEAIEKYACPRLNQSSITLKFLARKAIHAKLHFQIDRINQLPLSNSLKQYLTTPISIQDLISITFMDTFGVSKRILKELLSLTSDDYVRSFFTYEGCEQIENSNEFVIHGYLLPRYAPYKNGAYKIRIRIPENYPFTAPDIRLLTYIYHPAVSNDRSNPSFCKECCCNGWSSAMPLHHIIERLVLRIDQPELIDDYCVMNQQAKLDFDRNRSVFNENASKMIRKYATISVTLLNSPIKRQKLHHFTFE